MQLSACHALHVLCLLKSVGFGGRREFSVDASVQKPNQTLLSFKVLYYFERILGKVFEHSSQLDQVLTLAIELLAQLRQHHHVVVDPEDRRFAMVSRHTSVEKSPGIFGSCVTTSDV